MKNNRSCMCFHNISGLWQNVRGMRSNAMLDLTAYLKYKTRVLICGGMEYDEISDNAGLIAVCRLVVHNDNFCSVGFSVGRDHVAENRAHRRRRACKIKPAQASKSLPPPTDSKYAFWPGASVHMTSARVRDSCNPS